MTTRKWPSPRAAPGSASSGISATWTSIRRSRTSASPASATCPGTCSATACCYRGTSACRPRSSWDDYDRKKLSRGGGVFPRAAKSIPLAPEARALLGLESASAPPNEVIRAILRLPVDLLWNGGIGTYVKASDERNAEVGDRTNDAVRINGRELRARVVGEG